MSRQPAVHYIDPSLWQITFFLHWLVHITQAISESGLTDAVKVFISMFIESNSGCTDSG